MGKTYFEETMDKVRTGINGILEQDRYVDTHEPFFRSFNVVPMAVEISQYTFEKLNKLYNTIYEHTTGMSRMYVEKADTGLRAYFVAFQGNNGCGDFATNDVINAVSILQGLRKQYKSATMIDMTHDILDDVSAWSYVFEV